MAQDLSIELPELRQLDGIDPDQVRLLYWLSFQDPETIKTCLSKLSDVEGAELANVGLQLQMLLNSTKGELAAALISEADKALDEVAEEFEKKRHARAEIQAATKKGFFSGVWGAITGSTRAEIAKALEKNAERDVASLEAQNRVIKSHKKDAEVGLRLSKMQARLIILDQCIHCEQQKGLIYKISKSIRLLLSRQRGGNRIEKLMDYMGSDLKGLPGPHTSS